jgi:drug/metabolite transporter (DMT)-like permease
MKTIISISCIVLTNLFALSSKASAVSMTLEQKYQDVFVSAGYATALGAAIGAAMLSFKDEPTQHLRYVAVGASVGLFAGTLFGTYMVVSPSFALEEDSTPAKNTLALDGIKEHQLVVQPSFSSKSLDLNGIEAGMVLAKF